MKKLLIPVIILFVLFNINQDVMAQRDNQPDRQKFRESIKEKLNLTEDQQTKIEALRLSHEEEMIKLRNELELKEFEMKKLNSKNNVSREEVLELTRELSEIKGRMDIARANHRMDVYDLLDPEQRKVWLDIDRKMDIVKNKMKERHFNRRAQFN